MSQYPEHDYFISKKFEAELAKPILNAEEYELLYNFGSWMNALYLNKIEPVTEKQREFLEKMNANTPPEDQLFNIFWRYLKRLEILKEKNLDNSVRKVKDDREDFKKIRNMRF